MRHLGDLFLSYAAPGASPLVGIWTIKSAGHLAALRETARVFRELVDQWDLVVSRRGPDEPLRAVGQALDELAAVEGVVLAPPAVPDAEARALLDVADAAKCLLPQLSALLAAPRWQRGTWTQRLDATLAELRDALDRLDAVTPRQAEAG